MEKVSKNGDKKEQREVKFRGERNYRRLKQTLESKKTMNG